MRSHSFKPMTTSRTAYASKKWKPVRPSAEGKRIPLTLRWSLLLYAFSLPYEQIDLGFMSGYLSLARIAGLLVIASCMLHRQFSLSRPHPAFWFFSAYLLIHYFRGAFAFGDPLGGFLGSFLTLVQLVLLTWLISKPLRDERLSVQVFLSFSIACALLVVGMILKLPGFSDTILTRGVERTTAMGSNANFLGVMLAIALVIVIGAFLEKGILRWPMKVFLASIGLLLPAGIILTGSRTAIVCLMAGVAFYLMPVGKGRSLLEKVPFVLCCLVALGALVVRDPTSLSRLSSAYYERDLSGRDRILSDSLAMIDQKPFFGWGPKVYKEQLGADPHNIFVHLLLEVGIVGSIPYLLGIGFCVVSVWRSRNSAWGKVCFAAFATLMLSNLALNWAAFKPMWLLIAAAVSGAGRTASVKKPHPAWLNPARRRRGFVPRPHPVEPLQPSR